MPFDVQHLTGQFVSFGLVLFVIYRRLRRNFGIQRLLPAWMIFRVVLLAVAGLYIVGLRIFNPTLLIISAAGLAIGIGLGAWGASRTRFLKIGEQLCYIPHTYTGLVVTALFLGRYLYKIVSAVPLMTHLGRAGAAPDPQDVSTYLAYLHNPFTRLTFLILVGYTVYYYSRVLWESHHLKPEDWERRDSPAVKAQG